MKVYVVTAGEYSDYHIVKIFSSYKKAHDYCCVSNNESLNANIEEYELDNVSVDVKNTYTGIKCYVFDNDLRFEGVIRSSHPIEEKVFKDRYGNLTFTTPIETDIYVDDNGWNEYYDKIHKIMYDKYAEYKARKEGLTE